MARFVWIFCVRDQKMKEVYNPLTPNESVALEEEEGKLGRGGYALPPHPYTPLLLSYSPPFRGKFSLTFR